MNNLVNYKNASPYKFCFLIFLYAVGASSLPIIPEQIFDINSLNLRLVVFSALKILTIIFPLFIIKSIDYQNQFKFKKYFFKSTLILFPFLLVCINNVPIVAFLSGSAKIKNLGITYFYYSLVCLSISVFEELIFRGIIYSVLRERKRDILAIIYSSLIFSLAHLANALSLNAGAMLMQLGYSFLIGAMCAVAYKFSLSIYLPIILHFIYDLGGLLTNYEMVTGNIWNVTSIVVTAVLGVITFVYAIILYFVKEKNESSNTKG